MERCVPATIEVSNRFIRPRKPAVKCTDVLRSVAGDSMRALRRHSPFGIEPSVAGVDTAKAGTGLYMVDCVSDVIEICLPRVPIPPGRLFCWHAVAGDVMRGYPRRRIVSLTLT